MLERLEKLCSKIIEEQIEKDSFKNSQEMLEALNEKYSFIEFKRDRELIAKIKRTFKDIRDEALDRYYEESLKGEKQDDVISQIYHYVKEF